MTAEDYIELNTDITSQYKAFIQSITHLVDDKEFQTILSDILADINKMNISAPNEEDIVCDICGVLISDYEHDLFHHTGIVNGELNPHIHSCRKCYDRFIKSTLNFDRFREKYKEDILRALEMRVYGHILKGVFGEKR